jgi:hypothetical protein
VRCAPRRGAFDRARDAGEGEGESQSGLVTVITVVTVATVATVVTVVTVATVAALTPSDGCCPVCAGMTAVWLLSSCPRYLPLPGR